MIDDDRDICVLTHRYLTEISGVPFEFYHVGSAVEGLDALLHGAYDVYLVDYRLGRSDGLELVQKAVSQGCDAAIIMLTAHGSRELELKAMEAGAEFFLEKDRMDPVLLDRAIRLVLDRHRLRRSLADRADELEAANHELRLAESKLRESEKRLKAFTHAIPDLAFVLDESGLCREVYARSRKAACLKDRHLHEVLPPEIADAAIEAVRCTREGGEPQSFEYALNCGKGTKWFEARTTLMEDDSAKNVRVACVARDITSRKLTERTLSERTKELERSNDELQQFAYVASHDLQEPLRMIAGYTGLLQRRLGENLDEDSGLFMNYVLEGVTRMQHLIDDLLTYSRAGTQKSEPTMTCSRFALNRALEHLRPTIEETGATIRCGDLPSVLIEAGKLTQIFQNLIGNALKFRNEHPPIIESGVRDEGDFWRFCVRDNGIGLHKDNRERIFEIFQRLHGRNRYPGTGIGLSICKRIVENHGGSIWVESEPGYGATFYFTLPKTKIDLQSEDLTLSLSQGLT